MSKLHKAAEAIRDVALQVGWVQYPQTSGAVKLVAPDQNCFVLPPISQFNQHKAAGLFHKVLTHGDPQLVARYTREHGGTPREAQHLTQRIAVPEQLRERVADPESTPAPEPAHGQTDVGAQVGTEVDTEQTDSATLPPLGSRMLPAFAGADPLLTRPWEYDLSQWPEGVESLRFYYSPSTNVRLFGDGRVPVYECARRGCHFTSRNPRSIAVHHARTVEHPELEGATLMSSAGYALPGVQPGVPGQSGAVLVGEEAIAALELVALLRQLLGVDSEAELEEARRERDEARTAYEKLQADVAGLKAIVGSLG